MNYSDTLSFFFLKRYFFLYQFKPNVLCNYAQILCNLKSSDINEYATASSSCETDSACTVFEGDEMGNHLPIKENINRIEDISISEVDNPNLDEAELPPYTTSCSQEVQTSLPCTECEEKKDKIESLQEVRSKQRQRLQMRNKRIKDLQKENKNLKKVCDELISILFYPYFGCISMKHLKDYMKWVWPLNEDQLYIPEEYLILQQPPLKSIFLTAVTPEKMKN